MHPEWKRDENGRTLQPDSEKEFNHVGKGGRKHFDGRVLAPDHENNREGRTTLRAKRKIHNGETLVGVIAKSINRSSGGGGGPKSGGESVATGSATGQIVT